MTFTVEQIVAFILGLVGLMLTVLNIYDKITSIKKAADAPIDDLEKRVTALEVIAKEYASRLEKGNEHFEIQAEYNRRFMKVQLAFIDFQLALCQNLNYTKTENLEEAKNLVQDALTNAMR